MFTVLRTNNKSYCVIFFKILFIREDKNKGIQIGKGNLGQKIHIWKIACGID